MGLKSTQARLLAAQDAGHFVGVETKDSGQDKRYIVTCSCGYRSTARRSHRAVNQTLGWHIGAAIGLATRGDSVNGR